MWLLYFQVGCASRTWWIDTHSGISLNSPETQTLASHVIHILDSICWTKSVIIFFFHLSLKYDSAKTTSHWAFEKFWYFSVNIQFVQMFSYKLHRFRLKWWPQSRQSVPSDCNIESFQRIPTAVVDYWWNLSDSSGFAIRKNITIQNDRVIRNIWQDWCASCVSF